MRPTLARLAQLARDLFPGDPMNEELARLQLQIEQQVLDDAKLLAAWLDTPPHARFRAILNTRIAGALTVMAGSRPVGDEKHPIDVAQRNADREWLAGQVAGLEIARDLVEDTVLEAERVKAERRKNGLPITTSDEEKANVV
jgi:hypothetical protein